MAQYTREEIIDILRRAGIPEKDVPVMVAIALAESMGDPEAIGDENLVDSKWDESIGLFQIRSLKNPNDPRFNKADKLRIKDRLFDPVYNAKVAYEISKKGKTWKDWTTFTEGTYKKFMDTSPSRSNIRLAGGGIKGRSKPIAMAEETVNVTEENEDQFLVPAVVGRGGSALLIPKAKREANSKLSKERKKLDDLIEDFENITSTVTQEQIDRQTKKVEAAEAEVVAVEGKIQEVTGRKEKEASKEKDLSRTDTQISRIEQQLNQIRSTGKMPVVPGQRGPSSTAKKGYVKDLEDKLSDLRKEKQNLLIDADVKAVEDFVPKTPAYVNPATTTNVDGSPKPIVPKGTGETVYLGELTTQEKVLYPSLGGKTETREFGTRSVTSNKVQDRLELENMWFNNSPQAQALVQRFKDIYAAKGKVATESDWKSALNATAGVNTDNSTQTLWDTAEKMLEGGAGGGTGPSAKELKNRREAIKLIATELGVELTDGQVNSLGYDYANGNIDATTVRSRIAATGNINFATGEAAKTIDALKASAAAYGVSYDPSWYNQSARDILTGKVDNDTVTQQLKELAKSRYPSLVKQIDSGLTVRQVASPYFQSMANILEVNPNDITMEDPTIKQAFTSLNVDGQPSTKALWQFEQELKQDPRWRFTKNAQTDLMGTARKVLQDFGLVS
jgi:hypothetical protein